MKKHTIGAYRIWAENGMVHVDVFENESKSKTKTLLLSTKEIRKLVVRLLQGADRDEYTNVQQARLLAEAYLIESNKADGQATIGNISKPDWKDLVPATK